MATDPAPVDPVSPTAPSLTINDLRRQFWADVFGKEVQTAATYSYTWLADQFGHVAIGIVANFLATLAVGWVIVLMNFLANLTTGRPLISFVVTLAAGLVIALISLFSPLAFGWLIALISLFATLAVGWLIASTSAPSTAALSQIGPQALRLLTAVYGPCYGGW